MERVRPSGMSFLEGGRKFFIRGVSYGPFRPNELGEPLPGKGVAERDFALLRELGANTLRTYHVPPPWFSDLALGFGLRLLVGIPWAQHIRFLDSLETRREIRRAVRDAAHGAGGAPNLLGLLVGNEIPPQVVRWYGPGRVEAFLEELTLEVKEVCPEVLVSYSNFPMTEYLDLAFLDFSCFNVYLHREEDLRGYLSRLQNLAGARPLVLGEFGIDSIREGEDRQAEILERSTLAAAELGCAGAVAFSFTDEWHTGGFEIQDWAFGLVTRDRRPKPAFEALKRVYHSELPPLPDPAPLVSVVICAYNAERTLEECLESLRHLRYPNHEVIVVDDGSTDGTRAIAERFPGFRLISQENRGLSAARNVGIDAARGEVVAFTDADCAVDPDWLTLLVHRLLSTGFVGVGGPNLPPREEHWVPEVVARSPGGPTHVLITAAEAEHVPGCNMAFWRKPLVEVGSFDPVFRAAGDDVDVCWRLQNEGHKIGFAPAALVWHRRRHTLRAYLDQQRGYGKAEALLYFKHPHRFNRLGHSRWLGRIYTDYGPGVLGTRPVIYGGVFGSGMFQTLYEAPSNLLRHLPTTLEWNGAALGLLAIAGTGSALGAPMPFFWLGGFALLAISVGHAVGTALRVDVSELPRWRARLLIALLNYAGPLVRSIERNRHRAHGLSSHDASLHPAPREKAAVDLRGRSLVLSYWNETEIEKEQCIAALLDYLRPRKYAVVLDDGWQDWDLSVYRGVWVLGRVKILIQNHGGPRREVDVGMCPHPTAPAKLALGAYVAVGIVAAAAGEWAFALLMAAVTAGTAVFFARQARRLVRAFHVAVESSFETLPTTRLRPGARSAGGE